MKVILMMILSMMVIGQLVRCAEWSKLTALPDPEGFAGSFAGVSNDTLLVAGGANFPAQKPWEGGKKVWYDAVYALDQPHGEWKKIGKLPRSLGYGISVNYGDGVICIGGSDADRHYADVFRLEWTNGRLITTALTPLPQPIANASGALIGDMLFIAGGQERPDSTETYKTIWSCDLAARQPQWKQLEGYAGPGRMLAVAASFDKAFWLLGGVDLFVNSQGKAERRYLRDAYRYEPTKGWKRLTDLPFPVTAAPSPAPADELGFSILGGDDGSQVGSDPQEHRGFNQRILRYDNQSASWIKAGIQPAPRVTVPCTAWRDGWVIPSGEMRPGIRSPEVWKLTMKKTD